MSAIKRIGQYAVDKRWAEVEEILDAELASTRAEEKSVLLCELSFYGNERCIRTLIDGGADVNFRYQERGMSEAAYRVDAHPRTTPIGQAILGRSYGRFDTLSSLSMLLQANADPNGHTYQGYSPLQLSIVEDCPEHARALLEAGADPRLRCEDPLIPEGDAYYFLESYGEEREWAQRLLLDRRT